MTVRIAQAITDEPDVNMVVTIALESLIQQLYETKYRPQNPHRYGPDRPHGGATTKGDVVERRTAQEEHGDIGRLSIWLAERDRALFERFRTATAGRPVGHAVADLMRQFLDGHDNHPESAD